MGRKVMQPRLLAYMADDVGLAYTYSRTQLQARPWSPTVLRVKVLPLGRLVWKSKRVCCCALMCFVSCCCSFAFPPSWRLD